MEISLDKLRTLMGECYDLGYQGCLDLKNQDINDLVKKYELDRETSDYRVWAVEELNAFPDGSIFHHLTRGRCFIVTRANGSKFMQFRDGNSSNFNQNTDPWDKPMKRVSE